MRVAIVDDAVTTGGSMFKAIEAAEQEGCKVVATTTLVDRLEGGGDLIRQRGYRFKPLFTIRDFGIEPTPQS
jgi:orotate phosphoribosyltransferase